MTSPFEIASLRNGAFPGRHVLDFPSSGTSRRFFFFEHCSFGHSFLQQDALRADVAVQGEDSFRSAQSCLAEIWTENAAPNSLWAVALAFHANFP